MVTFGVKMREEKSRGLKKENGKKRGGAFDILHVKTPLKAPIFPYAHRYAHFLSKFLLLLISSTKVQEIE